MANRANEYFGQAYGTQGTLLTVNKAVQYAA